MSDNTNDNEFEYNTNDNEFEDNTSDMTSSDNFDDVYNYDDLFFLDEDYIELDEAPIVDLKVEDADISADIESKIRFLAKGYQLSDNELNEIIDKMSEYFYTEYRLSYYSLFQVISDIAKTPDDLNALTTNLEALISKVKIIKSKNDVSYKKFQKFYDYIMLETVRFTHQVESLELIKNTTETYGKLSNDLLIQGNEIESFTKKLKDAEHESINHLLTVLGVFSGIIIAFFGGIQFLGSAFNQINTVSKYRLFFTVLLIGFIIFNSIAVMMILLAKMTGKDIYVKCKTNDCSCKKYCSQIRRMKNKLPFMYYTNCMLVSFMVIIFILWSLSNYLRLPISF